MTTQNEPGSAEIEALELSTLQAILKGQNDKVLTLYNKVERLFKKGNEYTRSLIATRFIRPLSMLLEMNYSWGREYLTMFPAALKAEYRRQIYSTGV